MDSLVNRLNIDFSLLRLTASLAALLILYYSALFIYRLTFHPLAKFPGPKIAAVSFWYEFYYDWWCQGQYVFEIEKMHKKYGMFSFGGKVHKAEGTGPDSNDLPILGPIVRVNPADLSIHDPAAYNEIYVTESKRRTEHYDRSTQGMDFDGKLNILELTKNAHFTNLGPGSHLVTVDHNLHRKRRKPLEPFFSRQGVSRLEPMIIQMVEKLVARLEAMKGSKSVVRLDHALTALTGDVIRQFCCEDGEYFLDDADFVPWWYVTPC